MKKILIFSLIILGINASAQSAYEEDKKQVLDKVNSFFMALEHKDTVLYKTLGYTNAQIWVARSQQDSVKISMRYIGEDIIRLATMKDVIQEKPLVSEISIHGNIAVVWAPYTLSFSGKFSHCGIDVFTLLKNTEGWKIVSAVYTVEPEGCAVIKKEYNIR
jgi:hypothetical protein